MITQELLLSAFNSYSELRKFILDKNNISELNKLTSYLDKNSTTKQRMWHVINNSQVEQKCNCGNTVKWNTKNNTYRVFCSSKCAHIDESTKIKTRNTCIEKYGVSTNLITNHAKDNYASKMIERYGVPNPFKSSEFQDQLKSTVLEKYGVTNVSKLDSVKEKITATHMAKYSRIRESQKHISDESYRIKYDRAELANLYNGTRSIIDIATLLNVGHSQLCVQFNKFGIEIHQSVGQRQVYEYIKSIYSGTVVLNDRKVLGGKEIDIYLPDLNIGFEYDGIFWHSELSSGKIKYHVEKDKIANDVNIKLIHIIDLEWKTMQDIVKSRISSLVGCNKRVYARKTKIEIIDSKTASAFFNANHIQGNTGASFYAGLYLGDLLVAAISIGKSRYNLSQFELMRFCNILGHNVIGGASKLFKFAVNQLNATEIMTFADLRWGTGKLYSKLGFTHKRDNAPSYTYTHLYRTLESRVKYQKKNLEKLLPIFNPAKSEWENMKDNGYDRYWNSGNAVYIWKAQ
jgi:hypothetical protein